MEVNSVGYGAALTPEIQMQYAVKCIEMARATEMLAGTLIEDTVEISAEALKKCAAEMDINLAKLAESLY